MFLCDDCHGDCDCVASLFFRSHGPCESCKKQASCTDCHSYKFPKSPKVKTEEKKPCSE